MIDILKLRNNVIADYRSYIESFLDIRDERLKTFAKSLLDNDDLWPDPMLECNPGFEKGKTVNELVQDDVLHPHMGHIFTGFHLHKHQAEAIKMGNTGNGFIVTSGTGSGKSLTYLGTIFNHILKHPQKEGVRAIIVYPMNALINSQEEEIKKYQRNFLQRHLKPDSEWEAGDKSLDQQLKELSELATSEFPITFGKYTGQETQEAKKAMQENPPHIILTNYMMLELLLTRSKEAELRKSIFAGLEYLVFDELHTYRGRQGADVALLIRRIKAFANNKLACIGTSATLSSGSITQQKKDVISLGKQLFDEDYNPDQIIMEYLEARIHRSLPDQQELKESLERHIQISNSLVALEAHPLTSWLEQKVALSSNEGVLVRGIPQTIQEIIAQLARDSGLDKDTCEVRIGEMLQWLQRINQNQKDGILPFRVHQFIAQTGTIRVTLESISKRDITASEQLEKFEEGVYKPLCPIVFNRHSGLAYICVKKVEGKLKPWENYTTSGIITENQDEEGYILLDEPGDEPLWDESRAKELIPETWIEKRKSGDRIKKDKEERLPNRIWFHVDGTYSSGAMPGATKGWFMPAPLLLDPLSGMIYDHNTSDFNKLAQLGDAGRSTSTTILTYSTLKQLEAQKANDRIQKVMSFTDNRQDAALQSGHFNDFIQQALLRSAIYHAVQKHKSLDANNIASVVFEELAISEEEFAKTPGTRPHLVSKNEKVFKKWLLHQLFFDLRRGWRHRLPNLEQCGLLDIRYKDLHGQCGIDKYWETSQLLRELNSEDRFIFIRQFLNYFRSSFAVKHHELELNALEETKNSMRSHLKDGMSKQFENAMHIPFWACLKKNTSRRLRTISIGPSSSLGKYIRSFSKQQGKTIDHKGVAEEIPHILECLCEAGYLFKNTDLTNQPLYQLELGQIEWIAGNSKAIVRDEVRNRSAKSWDVKPNAYFRKLYTQQPNQLKQLESKEHTGQVPSEERQQIEHDFRNAKVKALYCSPTMELGIDIDELAVVHMRNVPPNPANYAQRSGRAGRKGQGALIFTFCSQSSAHDRHFFRQKMDMVTGKVSPQLLDLTNPDLLRNHLHAAYMAKCGLQSLNRSLAEVLNLENLSLPILPEIREQLSLSIEQKQELSNEFYTVVKGLMPKLEKQAWFSVDWITHIIEEIPSAFDRACQRWRDLYTEAYQAKSSATEQLKAAHLTQNSSEYRTAKATLDQSQRKLDLLRNKAGFKDFSEFYPYRYLASEGFLPGYNFTRLPIRIFLSDRDGTGNYVSRPRFQALVEFGPGNMLYQNGKKWRVGKMLLPPSEAGISLETLFIDKQAGYFSFNQQVKQHDVNIFSGESYSGFQNKEVLANLMPLNDMTAYHSDRISSQEDERTKEVFDTQLGFALRAGNERQTIIEVNHLNDSLLTGRFLPSSDLIRLNLKLMKSKDSEGFWLHAQKGTWESDLSLKEMAEEEKEFIRKVRLYTSITADCLYVEPSSTLQLDYTGIITLAYAFKRALEIQYQAEPKELAVNFLGDPNNPKILFYEAAEGSLGILSRLASSKMEMEQLLECMWEVCRFNKLQEQDASQEEVAATYDDLLSYYNQRHHNDIRRSTIRQALDLMKRAEIRMTS